MKAVFVIILLAAFSRSIFTQSVDDHLETTASEQSFRFPFVQRFQCFQCTNAKKNSECRRLVTCSWGSRGCENEIRLQNGELFISKHCKQFDACQANLGNNYGQCNPQTLLRAARGEVHLEKKISSSLCRSCCKKYRCNGKPFSAESVASEKRVGINRHRMLLPPIADVESTLTSATTALITFTDPSDTPGATYYITLSPSDGVTINAVKSSEIPNVLFNDTVPRNVIAYIANGLSGGTTYEVNIIKKVGFVRYAQGVFDTFRTPPKPLSDIKVVETFVDSLLIDVGNPQSARKDRYDSIRVSYRKSNDPESEEILFPKFSRTQVIRLSDLEPATEYNVSAWTSIDGPDGRAQITSNRVTIKTSTEVPAISKTELLEHHAKTLTWGFTVMTGNYPKEFVVSVRDDTEGRFVTENIIGGHWRRFEATGLIPEHYYSFTIKVKSGEYYSDVVQHEPVRTVTRCYTCLDATSRDECMEITECPPEARGCLVELRSRQYGLNKFSKGSFRASMTCKQVTACDGEEDQNLSTQCDPTKRKRNSSPPEVCRCCCEGDLCDGPGTDCGRLLGWLDPLATEQLTTPAFAVTCEDLSPPRQGTVSCTEGQTTLGTKCTFTCGSGTYLLGITQTECLPGGTWSHRTPECLPAKRCPAIESTYSMYAECTTHNRAFSSCQISCRPGYIRFGRQRILCRPNGVWTAGRGRCVERDECKPNPCVNRARCVDGVNSFECVCRRGYYGQLCERERTCEILQSPLNGRLECTIENKLGSRCRYTCYPGFSMHGTKYTRCNEEGLWTGGDPTLCVVNKCEIIPQVIINGGKSVCTGYSYNDTCTFSCPESLKVSGGPSRITCREDSEWSGDPPCCDLPCPPYARVDLLLVLDSSSSVGKSSWRELIKFTIALLDRFVVGRRDMRVGILRYNRIVDKKNEIELGNYKDAQDLKAKIRKIPYNGYGTKTGRALQHVFDHSIKVEGNRPGVPDAIVVITDGLASDSVKPPADALKSTGAKIYVAGIINKRDRVNVLQLKQIASGPKYLQIVDEGYANLVEKLAQQLINDVCWVPCQYQYERRELQERQRVREVSQIAEEERKYWESVDQTRQEADDTVVDISDDSEDLPVPKA